MAKFKIFVTRKIPVSGLKMLTKKGYQVKVSPVDRVLTKKEIIKNVKGIDALACLLTDKIDDEIMAAAGPKLKIIANYAVGYNNIDIVAAKKRKILVSNTPGVLTKSVAEFTISLIMAIAKRVVSADDFVRQKKFKGWEPMLFLGSGLFGKTLGIVGSGRIGTAVAEIAHRGLKMKIIYHSRSRNPQIEKIFKAQYVSLNQLLKKADFVSLHVPLGPATRHLIGAKELRLMKRTAYLINTSRGPVVDEKALYKALKSRSIRAAAIDVFEKEPKLTPGLGGLDNIIVTPHIASATEEARDEMSEILAANIIAALSNKKPKNLVN